MLPPSMPHTLPVTKEARSVARKTITLATSSGLPSRPSGSLRKRKAFGEGQDGCLRGCIIGKKRFGLPCQIGGVIDDAAAALRTHAWQHLCTSPLVAHEIEIPGGQPVVIGGLVKRAGNADAHIVHQHINTTIVSKQHLLNASLDFLLLRKIGYRKTHDKVSTVETARQFIETLPVPINERQMGSLRCESTRCGCPDTTGRSGDQHDLVPESIFHGYHSFLRDVTSSPFTAGQAK